MIIKSPNTNIKSITKEVKYEKKVICCSGGDISTGHPVVYYNFGNKKQITCQYCGTVYLKSK